MNNKEFNKKIKHAFDYAKRQHFIDNFESLVSQYGEQPRDEFNNLVEFSAYHDQNFIETFKNILYYAFETNIPENMDKTDTDNFEHALDNVENA